MQVAKYDLQRRQHQRHLHLCGWSLHRGNVCAVVDRWNALQVGSHGADIVLAQEAQAVLDGFAHRPAAELRPSAWPLDK
jgi:hypothetical protein